MRSRFTLYVTYNKIHAITSLQAVANMSSLYVARVLIHIGGKPKCRTRHFPTCPLSQEDQYAIEEDDHSHHAFPRKAYSHSNNRCSFTSYTSKTTWIFYPSSNKDRDWGGEI